MAFFKKYIFHSPVHYVIAFGLNVFFTLLVLVLKGFDQTLYYVDAFSVAGSVSILFGMLLWVSSAGAFTTFGYAFSTFRSERKYKDLYEYTSAKEEKHAKQKKIHMPYIMVGLVFLFISYFLTKSMTVF